jgi:hypothetical protein
MYTSNKYGTNQVLRFLAAVAIADDDQKLSTTPTKNKTEPAA